MRKSRILAELFFTMLKIGLFTFGGGYSMLALLDDEFVLRKKYMERDEFLSVAAIAESTPGPIAINASTYIGYKKAGFLGALCATVGVCIPSFVIIYVISLFFDSFLSLTYVSYAFRGIQAGVIFVILRAGFNMIKNLKKTPFNVIVTCAVAACMVTFSCLAVNFSAVFYVLICGTLGVAAYLIGKLRKKAASK